MYCAVFSLLFHPHSRSNGQNNSFFLGIFACCLRIFMMPFNLVLFHHQFFSPIDLDCFFFLALGLTFHLTLFFNSSYSEKRFDKKKQQKIRANKQTNNKKRKSRNAKQKNPCEKKCKTGRAEWWCVCVCVYFAVIVCSTRIHSARFTHSVDFLQNKRVHKRLILNIQICWLLFCSVCACVHFFNHMCAISPFAWVEFAPHRWFHLNWIKLTIRKSLDSCCIIWGGIPSILILCSPRFQYRQYHCHFLCRVIYTSNIALVFVSLLFPRTT